MKYIFIIDKKVSVHFFHMTKIININYIYPGCSLNSQN